MSITPFQPTLPLPIPFSEAELNFKEDEPPGLLPDNQDSNWGLFRYILASQFQQLVNLLALLYAERFVPTSSLYLDEHERSAGLPVAPAGVDTATRRAILLTALGKSMFTRARRAKIVETYITATFGTVAEFNESGIPFDAGGIPFHSEAGDISLLYDIVEDITNFHYDVYIINSITPDMISLRRTLTVVTPSGLSFTATQVPDPFNP